MMQKKVISPSSSGFKFRFGVGLISISVGMISGLSLVTLLSFSGALAGDLFVPLTLACITLAPAVSAICYRYFVTRSESLKLTINANRLETLLKNLPGMAYRCSNETHWPMEFVSDGCFDLCGYHRNELESQSVLWGDFTHPDMINELDDKVRSATKIGQPFEVEYRIINKTGDEKWVWERGRVVDTREDGVAILEGLITDITSRKLTETALVQAEAFAQAVVDSAVEAVITVDNQCNIKSFNLAAQSMFEQPTESFQGKHARILIAADHYAEFDHYFRSCQHQSTPKNRGIELNGFSSSEVAFPIHLIFNPVSTNLQQSFVLLIRDLTEQRTAEKEVREQHDVLAHLERLNTLGEMATGIAHEINQPLTAISMYAQAGLRYLQKENPRLDKLDDVLEKLSLQAHRAGTVIERTQEMTKQRDSHQQVVNCTSVIREVHKLAEIDAHINHYVIELIIDNLLPSAVCDPIQIQQVILNLLRNGMESMNSFGTKAGSKIILQAICYEGGVKISITDCGCGISKQQAKQLYQPFISTKQSGMGLGLSISRSIVASHGSQLDFYNNPLNGATFYFTLPPAEDDEK